MAVYRRRRGSVQLTAFWQLGAQ